MKTIHRIGTLFASILVCAFVITPAVILRGVDLQIEQHGTNLLVYWPTNARNFTLQIANQLPPTNGWQNLNAPVGVSDDWFVVTNAPNSLTRFFRLFKAQGEAPVLSAVTISTNFLRVTNSAMLQFSYEDPECDITALQLVNSSQLGVSTQLLAAPNLPVNQTAGSVSLELLPIDLVYGFNSITLRLVDRQGRLSSPAFFSLTLLGDQTGGSSPAITRFQPVETAIRRPGIANDGLSRLRPAFQLAVNDPDENLLVVRFRLFGPPQNLLRSARDFSPAELGLTTAGGATNVFPFEITSSTPPGNYTLSCQLFDRANKTHAPTNLAFTVASFPQHPVQIQNATPSSGRPGTIVELPITGLDARDTNAFTLSLGGIELPVLTNEANQVFTEIPAGAATGRFILQTSNLVVASASTFQVLTNLTLSPDYVTLLPGEAVKFTLASHTDPPPPVTWRVESIPGGSSINGVITSLGNYVAPANIASNRLVTVTATLNSDTNIFGIAQVELNQTPATPGTNFVLAANGGRVLSQRGGASLVVPAGALAINTSLSIRSLTQAEYPAPPPGQRLLAFVELGPGGLVFGKAVTVRLPLNCHCPPDSVVPLRRYDPDTGQFLDEGITATVAPNGVEAVAQLPHFSKYGVLEMETVRNFSPRVTALQPAVPLEEGRTVPIRVEGTGLVPDTLVTVHPLGGGPLVSGFHVDSWLGKETNGGFVLNIPVIRDLGEGQTRDFELHFENFSQVVKIFPFTVLGLDELVVPNGVTVTYTNTSAKKWSEVYVEQGGTVRLTSGVIDWQVTDSTVINGTLDARGNDGANGNGRQGGAAGQNGAEGGFGRSDGFLVDFDPEPPTSDGDRVVPGGRSSYPQGKGGGRGGHISGSHRRTIENWLSDCRDDPNGRSCGEGISDLFDYDSITDSTRHEFADYGFDTDSLPSGWIGFSAPRHSLAQPRPVGGHGGGGGGGSGEVSASFNTGGGGGAGGDGGLGVRLVGASEIYVRGLITTDGGRGGQGVRATDGLPQAMGEQRPDVLVLSGGGGGGGSAGELIAVSGGGVFHRTVGGRLSSRGGAPGDGGIVIYDASEARGYPTVFRSLRPPPDGAPGEQYTAGPPFTPAVLRHTVTEHSLLKLNETQPLGQAPLEIEVHGEQPGQVRIARIVPSNNPEFERYLFGATTIQPGAAPPYRLNLLLFPGFNTIAIRPDPRGGYEGSIANPIYELVFKRILSLPGPDTDGDGLSDADEILEGTNPNSADTDQDGAPDGEELLAGDDPTNADSDGDCVPDPVERQLGTSPRLVDSDADQVADGIEWMLGFNPLTLPPGAARYCPITNGPPAGALFAQVRGKTGGFRLAMLDLTSGRAGAVGFPDAGFGFGMTFQPNGDLLLSLGSRLAEAAEAFCYVPFPNYGSSVAVNRSGRTATGTSVSHLPGSNFVGGIVFGPQVGANTRRIDPLATDASGNIPVSDVATFEINGASFQAGSMTYFPGAPPYLIGVVLAPGTLDPTGQLFRHALPTGPTTLIGVPYNRDIKAVARFVDSGGANHLYGVAEASPEDELVDLAFGGGPNVTRIIGPLGHDDVWGLAQHPNGQLYASAITTSGINKSSEILLLNPAHAAQTTVASYRKDIFGITFAPCPSPCFGPALPTANWPNIRRLAAVDFNQDGNDDLAMIATENAGSLLSTLVLMQSDGLGGFRLLTNHVMGGGVFDSTLQIEVADLNNDGWPDLVCKNLFANPPGVMVATNDATGNYPALSRVQTPTDPTVFDVGELTGDAFPDLLIGIRGSLQLYTGNGDGTFTHTGPLASFLPNDDPSNVIIGDFNNDSRNDFLFAAFRDQRIYVNNGTGGYTQLGAPLGLYSGRAELTDFNDDGILDLVQSGQRVYLGIGTGQFNFATTYPFFSSARGGGPIDFVLAELDGNRFPDLLLVSPTEKRVHLWLNKNGNGFTTARQNPIEFVAPFSAAVGDFDGNGSPDLAISELVGGSPNGDHVKILLGN